MLRESYGFLSFLIFTARIPRPLPQEGTEGFCWEKPERGEAGDGRDFCWRVGAEVGKTNIRWERKWEDRAGLFSVERHSKMGTFDGKEGFLLESDPRWREKSEKEKIFFLLEEIPKRRGKGVTKEHRRDTF